jgi:hypothetical protein
MKASEIFLEYCVPIRQGLPDDVSITTLKKMLMIPELVWNAVVIDKNKNRKLGDLPDLLKSTLHRDFPAEHQQQGSLLLKFWVERKDRDFADFKWPISTEIYENLKKELIVRVKVHDNKYQEVTLPKEWSDKKTAPVMNLRR